MGVGVVCAGAVAKFSQQFLRPYEERVSIGEIADVYYGMCAVIEEGAQTHCALDNLTGQMNFLGIGHMSLRYADATLVWTRIELRAAATARLDVADMVPVSCDGD